MSIVCFQAEVSATGRSLIQRSPTDCGVIVCGLEISSMRRLCCCARERERRSINLSSYAALGDAIFSASHKVCELYVTRRFITVFRIVPVFILSRNYAVHVTEFCLIKFNCSVTVSVCLRFTSRFSSSGFRT